MNFLLKDIECSIPVTWDFFIKDISNSINYNPYCNSQSYYEVFKNIALSMMVGKEVILLDSDFTDSELIKLTGYSNFENFAAPIDKENFVILNSKEEFIKKLRNISDDWKVTLFTSGTTGIPKKITHNFSSITRFVKITEKNTRSVWGFAYSPTHMAGLQVYLQALLNGNSIVRLFGLNAKEIHKEIRENGITHISATPTFYRLLLPCNEIFPLVERITSGGEKFSEKIILKLKIIFPNAKIINVYASTEAGTLFASENEVFSIKPEFESLIRIENNELLVHSSLLGLSENKVMEWYSTGDLIEVIRGNPLGFRFISRKSDMINVGGFKVNPLEVEEIILTISGVENVRVYAKKNSVLGNIVCCEIVCSSKQLSESSIRIFLQSKIQEFKIPRIIRFVSKLSVTRTGKIKRNRI